jgi:hypothetical protein
MLMSQLGSLGLPVGLFHFKEDTMSLQVWDTGLEVIETINISCDKALSQSINDAAAVDGTGGTTVIPSSGHGYQAGSQIYISGSVNYNGLKLVTAVGANTLTILAPYVAETFSTDIMRFAYPCVVGSAIVELRAHLSAAPTTPENLVITIDSVKGAEYDTVVLTKAMTTITDYVWAPETPILCDVGDLVVCTYTNTDAKALGIQLRMKRIVKPGTRE